MTAAELDERLRPLEERRFEEEVRRADRELSLRERQHAFEREQFATNKPSSWSQVFSPLGVAILAGLIGLATTVVTGRQNLELERKKQDAERNLLIAKQHADETLERQKQQAALILKLAEQTDDKQRARNLLFFAEGGYLAFPAEYRTYLRKAAGLEPGQQIPPPSFTALVPVPVNPNGPLVAASPALLLQLLGKPCNNTATCSEPTNPTLRRLLVADQVGGIRFRGLRPAVAVVKRVLLRVQEERPDLFLQIQSEGMLCCRAITRGSVVLSPHSWGTAIDLGIGGDVASPGTNQAQYGVTLLAPYFAAEKFTWGAGEGRDAASFHFSASEQILREWQRQGLLR